MSKRTYNIQFPYKPSWIERQFIHRGFNESKYKGDIAKLKPDLQKKLETCDANTEFTKADFDGLPDPLWAKLADHFE